MKLLIVDQDGVGLSLAWRSAMSGHQVRWFVEPKPSNPKNSGKGFKGIERIDNWVPSAKWADLVITTSNGRYLEKLEWCKKQGVPYFGPTPASAKLEISRKAGMELLKKHNIEVAEYQTFPTMDAAAKHVAKTNKRFVFKTLGDNEDKSLTYVSKHAADLLQWIERTPPAKGEVMLQEFVEGIEMGVSRFMGSKGFVGPWNESFEHKKMMSGGFGMNTGEMGTVAYFTKESKLGEETLGKLEKDLVALGHTGDVALGFMIPEKGAPKPTEFTCRFGWPIENMMLGATKDDPISWMKDALSGKDSTSFSEEIGACWIMAHADFPHGNATKTETSGVPIFGVTKGNKKHLHPQSVFIEPGWDMDGENPIKRPLWKTSGDYVLVVTGFGKDVKQATERGMKTVKQLSISNAIVRDDIGELLKDQLPKLHALGYATHCDWEKK